MTANAVSSVFQLVQHLVITASTNENLLNACFRAANLCIADCRSLRRREGIRPLWPNRPAVRRPRPSDAVRSGHSYWRARVAADNLSTIGACSCIPSDDDLNSFDAFVNGLASRASACRLRAAAFGRLRKRQRNNCMSVRGFSAGRTPLSLHPLVAQRPINAPGRVSARTSRDSS